MSTYTSLRDALRTTVATVSNVGAVFGSERYSANWEDYVSDFLVTISTVEQYRGWWVTLNPELGVEAAPFGFGTVRRTYHFVVRGILGLNDETNTEGTFYDLMEAVMLKLDTTPPNSVSGVIITDCGPTAVRRVGWANAGDVLCHYAEIAYPVSVEVAL